MPVEDLPSYVKFRKAAFSMYIDEATGRPYADNLSIFRCLALHGYAQRRINPELPYAKRSVLLKTASRGVRMAADVLAMRWNQYKKLDERDFHGVPLKQFDELERLFDTNVKVYRYEPPIPPSDDRRTKGEGVVTDLAEQLVIEADEQLSAAATCHLVYGGAGRELTGGTMLVNVYTDAHGVDHFSYIADLRRFAATHVCDKCHYIFSCARKLRLHKENQTDCDQVQHLFPGNGAVLPQTLFERLDDVGIRVDEARRYYPHFAVFDLESCAETNGGTVKAAYKPLPRRHALPQDEPASTLAPDKYVKYWPQLRTHSDPNFRFCVVRGPFVRNIEQHAYALAQEQKACFNLRVKVLRVVQPKLVQSLIGTFPGIRNESDFRKAAAELLTATLESFCDARAYAVRLEVVPPAFCERSVVALKAVSVAIATNVSGFESSFFCRREDDEPVEDLVYDFVNRLHQIQAAAAERMRAAYAHEIERLEEFADGYTRCVEKVFVDALADSKERLAALTTAPQPGQVSAAVQPSDIAAEQERQRTLSEIDFDETDFTKLRLTAELKAAMQPSLVTDFFVARASLKAVKKLQCDLDAFCNILPVFGYNSGTFDIKLIRRWLLPCMQAQQRDAVTVLKKGTKYLQVASRRLRFLDVSRYVAPFTTYAKWVTAYTHGAETKGAWCYDYFERPSQLRETSLPPREAFDSVLKGTRCSEAEYAEIEQIWRENGMRTLYDYLRYYNLRDVEPFVTALETMRAFWQTQGHDMFNNVCTLPGLADRFVRKNFLPRHTNLVLPQKVYDKKTRRVVADNTDLYHDMRRSIVGGPACVYHRYHAAGETRLRGNGALCQHIVGWDVNGLYLKCAAQPMPTGIPVRYTPQPDGFFKRTPIYRKVQSQIEWLEWMAHVYGYDIRHQFYSAKPPYVAGQRPDGYCITPSGQQVLFFFDGCRYHGHGGCRANRNAKFPVGVDPRRKRARDFAITRELEERGFIVKRFRECQWLRMKKSNQRASEFAGFVPRKRPDGSAYDPTLREFVAEHLTLPLHGKMTEAGLLERVRRGRFFGTLICDVEVPERLRAHFAEFEPIFKNVVVTENDLSPDMRSFLETKRGRKRKLMKPTKTLLNSFFVKDFPLHTPLARWYLEHDLVIRNVTEAYEYKPKILYADFARTVADHRRRADADPDAAIKGDLFKLAGNSIYGKSVTAVERHTQTCVWDRRRLALHERNPSLVKSVDWLDDDRQWAEVELRQKKIEHKLYTPFGSFVYQYAKLRMLRFYYDFLDYFWEREHFQLMYMDTDSFYVALAQPSLGEFMKQVRPHRLAQFKANYPEQFLARDDPNLYTAEQIRFDRREVGLLKVETQAKKMLALNAKSYICVGISPSGFEQVQKLSAKGVIRSQNPPTWDMFYDVLRTKNDHVGVSHTLQRPHGRQEVCSITAPKRCLSFKFIKRRLLHDGVTTEPLGL